MPSVVAPFLNVTVPLGVPEVDAFTATVNFTAWPTVDGLSEDASAVEVAALSTVCESAGDVLASYCVLPLYSAVMECAPTARVDVVNVAFPAALRVAVPSVVVPSFTVTVPLDSGVRVTVNVTGCP